MMEMLIEGVLSLAGLFAVLLFAGATYGAERTKVRNFNFDHPEKLEGEMFLTNMAETNLGLIRWESKRVGEVAYSNYGCRIEMHRPTLFPVFVSIEEAIERGYDPEEICPEFIDP